MSTELVVALLCLGYAAFLDELSLAADPMLGAIREDVASLNTDLERARPRLVALQIALISLLAFLDPEYIRFPKDRRSKVVP